MGGGEDLTDREVALQSRFESRSIQATGKRFDPGRLSMETAQPLLFETKAPLRIKITLEEASDKPAVRATRATSTPTEPSTQETRIAQHSSSSRRGRPSSRKDRNGARPRRGKGQPDRAQTPEGEGGAPAEIITSVQEPLWDAVPGESAPPGSGSPSGADEEYACMLRKLGYDDEDEALQVVHPRQAPPCRLGRSGESPGYRLNGCRGPGLESPGAAEVAVQENSETPDHREEPEQAAQNEGGSQVQRPVIRIVRLGVSPAVEEGFHHEHAQVSA